MRRKERRERWEGRREEREPVCSPVAGCELRMCIAPATTKKKKTKSVIQF